MRFRDLTALLVILLAAPAIARAQETTGSLQGRVVDSQALAMPGATVTAAGTQGAKSTTTDAGGRFTIPFLTPGEYSIRAELSGFKTVEQKDVTVGLGQTVELMLKMEPGGVSERVEVTGAVRAVDTTSTTTGAVLSNEQITQVPMGRRVSDTLYMAPGVSNSGSAGQANPSMSGGSGLDNQYVIDGVNVTNTGYGALGSYSIEFGSLGNSTPFDFIKEVQVKTGGYEAEYGQALGGVMNVITKSGSNSFQGSAFGYTRPQNTEGTWTQYQSADLTTVQTLGTHAYDAGVEGGGPLLKDRLFFYGAIDPSWDTHTLEAPAGRPLLSLGPVDRERRNINYAAKGTWQINGGNRIDASFFGDPSTGFSGPQRPSALTVTDTSSYSSMTYGGHNQTVRYSGALTNKWLLEATYSRALNDFAETPSTNTWRVTDRTVTPLVTTGGIGFFEPGNNSLDNQLSMKSTNIVSGHQLKYGLEYDHVDYTQNSQYSGASFLLPNGQMTASGATITILPDMNFGQIYRVSRATTTPGIATTQDYLDFFVQDTWKVGNRLTINPGLRYEQEKQAGLQEQLTLNNNWAPRIGATFDLTGNGQSKLYGSYGRFYARMPNDLAARALSVNNLISLADYYDANLTQPIPNGVVTQVPGSSSVTTNHFIPGPTSPDTIDPNIKMSYTNEYIIGFEREVMPHTTFGARYIYRNLGRTIEDVQNAPYIPYLQGDPSVTYNYYLTNPSSSTPVFPQVPGYDISFADPVHKYQAVELTLNRRLSNHWSALASYRWSRLRGNYEGFYDNLNGQSDPGITAVFDFPYNDPSYTALGGALGLAGDVRFLADPNGILALDQPHNLKLFGNYSMDNGLNFGVGFNASSGLPLTPLAFNVAYGEAGDIPTAPLGSGIQTVDGFKTRTPFITQTDVQVSYALKLARQYRVTLLADIFNLFDQGTVLTYNTYTQVAAGTPNPNFGEPVSPIAIISGPQFQTPRQIRFGVRFTF